MVTWVQQKPGTLHGIGFSQIVSQIPSPKYSDGVTQGHERGSVLTDTIQNCRYTVIIKSKYSFIPVFQFSTENEFPYAGREPLSLFPNPPPQQLLLHLGCWQSPNSDMKTYYIFKFNSQLWHFNYSLFKSYLYQNESKSTSNKNTSVFIGDLSTTK